MSRIFPIHILNLEPNKPMKPKSFLLLLLVFNLLSCQEESSKAENLWPGTYQAYQVQNGITNYVELSLDTNGIAVFTRIESESFAKETSSDSLIWNEAGTEFRVGENLQFQLVKEGLKGINNSNLNLEKVEILAGLEDQKWILTELKGNAIDNVQGRPVSLLLNSAIDKMSGYDACNYLGASYWIDYKNSAIRLSAISGTKRYCQNTDSLAQEYNLVLQNFDRFELNDQALYLLNGNKIEAIFEKEK